MSNLKDLKMYIKVHKDYTHNNFYIWQRKRFNILVKKDRPIGGKWSYDVKNRKPFPKSFETNKRMNFKPKLVSNKYINGAKKYIEKHFKDSPGSTNFFLPIDHNSTKRYFTKFLKERLRCFGPYQDAVHKDILFGCHSVISPLLNIGIITPNYVVKKLIKYGKKYRVPLYSLEAIIRQIIGWREYVRMLYMFERKKLSSGNFLNHKRKLGDYWFKYVTDRSTGFMIIDDMINKVMDYGYLHHIERLMYIGNYMLINKIHPKQCFIWMMVMFQDAYNWVMYPNVYGMSQYSAGPIMMSRPYFSSSNYIDKMSNYDKKKNKYKKLKLGDNDYEWFKVWDAIYYNFISTHKSKFKDNYAISRQIKHWDNKNKSEQKKIKQLANLYMDTY